MTRRQLLSALAALALLMPLAPLPAAAGETLDYREGLVEELLDEDRTLFVTFSADWCSTCRVQERIIDRYRTANPEIDGHVTFVRVDWDQHSGSEIVFWYDVPRRSTLIVLRGEDEIGRIVGDTRPSSINGLLDRALAAGRDARAG